ncbi:MAG: hypothetical protein R2727_06585 [Bacteroidales bacterium]
MKGRVLRKMGYIKDQQGIIRRYLREMGGWDTHLHHTRNYILESVKRREPAKVTILAAGGCSTFPLRRLLKQEPW